MKELSLAPLLKFLDIREFQYFPEKNIFRFFYRMTPSNDPLPLATDYTYEFELALVSELNRTIDLALERLVAKQQRARRNRAQSSLSAPGSIQSHPSTTQNKGDNVSALASPSKSKLTALEVHPGNLPEPSIPPIQDPATTGEDVAVNLDPLLRPSNSHSTETMPKKERKHKKDKKEKDKRNASAAQNTEKENTSPEKKKDKRPLSFFLGKHHKKDKKVQAHENTDSTADTAPSSSGSAAIGSIPETSTQRLPSPSPQRALPPPSPSRHPSNRNVK